MLYCLSLRGVNIENLVDHPDLGKPGNPSALGAEDRWFESSNPDSSGCSSVWLESSPWTRVVAGSNPAALTDEWRPLLAGSGHSEYHCAKHGNKLANYGSIV